MVDTFNDKLRKPKGEAQEAVAVRPKTSIWKEPYQRKVMLHFDLRGVIGKGGLGSQTLQSCLDIPAAYFHTMGEVVDRRICGEGTGCL